MKTIFRTIIVAGTVILAVSCGNNAKKTEAAVTMAEDVAPSVAVAKVTMREVPQMATYTSTVQPYVKNNIAPQSGNRIKAIKADVGDFVSKGQVLAEMDLKGSYQRKNLRTVLAALDALGLSDVGDSALSAENRERCVAEAIVHAAERVGFHGRWEQVSESPRVICDIGHNEHGLKYNFAQLEAMLQAGECTDLIILYGSVSDKDVDAVMRLMPRNAKYVFTQANGKRALPAETVPETTAETVTEETAPETQPAEETVAAEETAAET